MKVPGLYFVQEDSGDLIGQELASWIYTINRNWSVTYKKGDQNERKLIDPPAHKNIDRKTFVLDGLLIKSHLLFLVSEVITLKQLGDKFF